MCCRQGCASEVIEIDPTERQGGFIRIEKGGVDGPKVLQHERPAFIRVQPKVMFAIERMKEAVAFTASFCQKNIECIQRLRVIETIEELAERVAINGVENFP